MDSFLRMLILFIGFDKSQYGTYSVLWALSDPVPLFLPITNLPGLKCVDFFFLESSSPITFSVHHEQTLGREIKESQVKHSCLCTFGISISEILEGTYSSVRPHLIQFDKTQGET